MDNKTPERDIYDLAVIGNGIAAKSFLWNLSHSLRDAKKSQNFSIAHLYSEKMTPSCSLRSSATASLNGIEEDVSTLGDDLREAFFLFDDLFKRYAPLGVEALTRTVVATDHAEEKKIKRRYKDLLTVSSPLLKESYPGTQFSSYLIDPPAFLSWLHEETHLQSDAYPFFVRNFEKDSAGFYRLILENKEEIKARKILFTTGAFSKVFSGFFNFFEEKNVIKAGSYLEKNLNLGNQSFFLTIDGHQVLYKSSERENILQLGSLTTLGAFEAVDWGKLKDLFLKLQGNVNFEMGKFEDFKVVTGLRHKGPRRLAIFEKVENENVYKINGLYKNGFTLSFLTAKKMRELLDLF